MRVVALTTTDNPYCPVNETEHWEAYDSMYGYGTSELLARFVELTDLDSDSITDDEIEEAIDRIVELFGENFYQKVVKEI